MFFTFSANLGENMTKVILFLIYVDNSTNIIEKCLTIVRVRTPFVGTLTTQCSNIQTPKPIPYTTVRENW